MQALDSILISFYVYFSGPSHRTTISRASVPFCFAHTLFISKMCRNYYTAVLIRPLNCIIMGTHVVHGAGKSWNMTCDKGHATDIPVNSEEDR